MSGLLRHLTKPVLSCSFIKSNQLKLQQSPQIFVNLQSTTRAFSAWAPIKVSLGQDSLTPVHHLPSAGIKHVAHPRKRCRHCYFQVKDEQRYVMCTANPRHYTAERQKNKKWGNYVFTHATTGVNDKGHGRGSRHMKTQNSFRLDY